MERTTTKQLKYLINEINKLENRPLESYSQVTENGQKVYRANVGNLHLEKRSSVYGAYSVSVFVMSNVNGGVSYFFNWREYFKPSELEVALKSYLQGIRDENGKVSK